MEPVIYFIIEFFLSITCIISATAVESSRVWFRNICDSS